MKSGGYPPGTSRRDLIRGGIINPHDHDHQFERVGCTPIIEDGAAIFREECLHEDQEHGRKYGCEAYNTYRFEYSHLISPDGTRHDLPSIEEWPENPQDKELLEKVVSIEEAYHNKETKTLFSSDPDEESGEVKIVHQGWELYYAPE